MSWPVLPSQVIAKSRPVLSSQVFVKSNLSYPHKLLLSACNLTFRCHTVRCIEIHVRT